MADALAKLIAELPGVRATIRRTADTHAAMAQAKLAAHRKTGAHTIGVIHMMKNSVVWMEGPASGAVEFGHFARNDSTWVPGINALTGRE